jgi:RNase P subunit RPR2
MIKKGSNMMNRFFIVLCVYLLGGNAVYAENYYIQALDSAQVSTEKLQESAEKVKEHKGIKVFNDLEVPPFHKRGEWEKKSLSKTFCTGCHLSPPHTKNVRSRTFLNMHTEYIACETCHLRPKNVQFSYQWMDYRNKKIVLPDEKLFRQSISMNDSPKKAEEEVAVRKMDKLIKIAPFLDNKSVIILRGHQFAQQSRHIWKEGRLDERIAHRAKVHVPLKEKGPECKACHQKDQPMLDLQKLGANKKQVRRIQNHIIPQFFKRYKEDEQKIRINNLLK